MSIKLKGSSDGSVSFDAPADTSPSGSDITLTLPTSAGSADQFLKNSGIAGELEYSSMVEDSSGNLGLGGITSPTWASDGGIHLGDDYGIGFGDGGSGRPDFQVITAGDGRLDLRCGFGADDADISIDSTGRLGIASTSPDAELHVGGSEPHIDIGPDDSNRGKIGYKSNDLFFGTSSSSGEFRFKNNVSSTDSPADSGTERMKIASNGEQQHFGTNATNLNIANSASANTNNEFLYCQHSSTGLANGTNSFRVTTNGNVTNTNNSYGSLSDQRLKENIVDATSQWDDIKGLQVRKYNFREATGHETHTQLGLIAQEVESVSPGLVETSAVKEGQTVLGADGNQLESIKSINYSVLYMKAVKALQEAQTRIETLESQHADLLARVTALEG